MGGAGSSCHCKHQGSGCREAKMQLGSGCPRAAGAKAGGQCGSRCPSTQPRFLTQPGFIPQPFSSAAQAHRALSLSLASLPSLPPGTFAARVAQLRERRLQQYPSLVLGECTSNPAESRPTAYLAGGPAKQ